MLCYSQAGRRNLQSQKLRSWKFIFLTSYGINIKYFLLCDFFLMLNKKLLFLYTLDNDRRDTVFLVPCDQEDKVREVTGRLKQNSASGTSLKYYFCGSMFHRLLNDQGKTVGDVSCWSFFIAWEIVSPSGMAIFLGDAYN